MSSMLHPHVRASQAARQRGREGGGPSLWGSALSSAEPPPGESSLRALTCAHRCPRLGSPGEAGEPGQRWVLPTVPTRLQFLCVVCGCLVSFGFPLAK